MKKKKKKSRRKHKGILDLPASDRCPLSYALRSHNLNQSWATLLSVQAQQLLVMSFILLHVCNVQRRIVRVVSRRAGCPCYHSLGCIITANRMIILEVLSKRLSGSKGYNLLQYFQNNTFQYVYIYIYIYLSTNLCVNTLNMTPPLQFIVCL